MMCACVQVIIDDQVCLFSDVVVVTCIAPTFSMGQSSGSCTDSASANGRVSPMYCLTNPAMDRYYF